MSSAYKSAAYRATPTTLLAGALATILALGPAGSLAQDIEPTTPQTAPPPPPEGSVGAMGDINLFPKRVVINGRREIASIGLYNKTVNPGDYEIRLVDMAMTPDGRLIALDKEIDEATRARVQTASGLLRHSPRRVALRGSESQLVRVMARAAADIPDGEYRSHFVVTSVPPIDSGLSIENAAGGTSTEGIGVTIRPRFGISIPVIVRIGETTLDVGIKDISLLTSQDGTRAIRFTVPRAGMRSAFGDVVVTAKGADQPVAISKGIGVYPEVDSRQVTIPVNPELDPRFVSPGTRLKIEFIDDDFKPGAKLAEQEFVVP